MERQDELINHATYRGRSYTHMPASFQGLQTAFDNCNKATHMWYTDHDTTSIGPVAIQ